MDSPSETPTPPAPLAARKAELHTLQALYDSREPQLLAVYGRRRIGKTYLIHSFFHSKGLYLEVTGSKEGLLADQLLAFSYELSQTFYEGEKIKTPKSWTKAFLKLHEALKRIPPQQKVILFFDEVPWLASRRSRFLPALEHAWNRYFSRRDNLIMIVCGSSASWMVRKILNNRGGLHGRLTKKMRLLPFTLAETEEYLFSRQIHYERKQICDLYLAIGGIAKYLLAIERGLSAHQNINRLCFSPQGDLRNEFDNLYRSLFTHHEKHTAIVKALGAARYGLSKFELLKRASLSSGGTSSQVIQDLLDAGFIAYVPTFEKKKVGGRYLLIDEYSLFYLFWMQEEKPISIESTDPGYWLKKQGTPQWYSWSGLAFESLCLKHISNIKKALGISGIVTREAGWKGTQAQIDLVIDRADGCINLCEIKYQEAEFVMDKEYASKLKEKKRQFKEGTGTKKTLLTTLITPFGAKKNSHFLESVDSELTLEALF